VTIKSKEGVNGCLDWAKSDFDSSNFSDSLRIGGMPLLKKMASRAPGSIFVRFVHLVSKEGGRRQNRWGESDYFHYFSSKVVFFPVL